MMHNVPLEVGEIADARTTGVGDSEVEPKVPISSPGLLESALATTFSLPCLYSIIKMYPRSLVIHLC